MVAGRREARRGAPTHTSTYTHARSHNAHTHLGEHVVEHAHRALPLPRLAVHVDERVVRHHVWPVPLGAHLAEHVEREVARVALLVVFFLLRGVWVCEVWFVV